MDLGTPWKIRPWVGAIDILDADGDVFCHIADRSLDNPLTPLDVARFIVDAGNDRADLVKALGGFLWLGANLHNITEDPVRFRLIYEAALVDARKAYRKAGGEE